MKRRTTACLILVGWIPIAPAFDHELRFVEQLTAVGFPDLAETVLSRTLTEFPESRLCAPELRIRILIAQKRFAAAQEAMTGLQYSQPLQLFLARTAHAAQQIEIAERVYAVWFESLTEADEEAVQAAFRYGQLLEDCGKEDSARAVYERLLECSVSNAAVRPVKARLAGLLVERDPERALKLAEDVQLGGLDLWFGQAVVTWAQIKMAQGERKDVQPVLETQLERLYQFEERLKERNVPVSSISPLAGARFLLGCCYEQADRPADALHQFYNVYVKYGDSRWGPQAQKKSQTLIKQFEAQGRTVRIESGTAGEELEQGVFLIARRLFSEKKYAEAAAAYLTALNELPEGSESVSALRNLTLCSIHLNDSLQAETVAAYLAERFADRPAAGDALLAIGKCALDRENEPLAWWVYDRYISCFPNHPRVPQVLFSLASLRDDERYLEQIIERYPESPYCTRALGRRAWNAFEAENYSAAAERFPAYVQAEIDCEKWICAEFAFAESCRFFSQWENARTQYRALETKCLETADSFGTSAEVLEFNQPFLEKSIYYQAVCCEKLGESEKAVQICVRLISAFPESEIIPKAHFAKARILIETGQFADALVTLEFFGSEAEPQFAEPVLYYRGLAQLETGQFDSAVQTLNVLLTRFPVTSFFYDAQFALGRAYAAAGQNNRAVEVFGEILNMAEDELILHRAGLELARAQTKPSEKLASFQRVALLADPADPKQSPLIAEALFESLPLYLKLSRSDDLFADADRLVTEFPDFGRTEKINQLVSRAKVQRKQLTAEQADGAG